MKRPIIPNRLPKKIKRMRFYLQRLKKSGKAGLARFVLRSTESLVHRAPGRKDIVVTRIRFAQQIREQDELKLDDDIKVSDKELKMGLALIDQYAEPLDLSKYKDEYHTELMNIIEQKAKGKRPTIKKLKPKAAKGDDLYDQLMSSLNAKERSLLILIDNRLRDGTGKDECLKLKENAATRHIPVLIVSANQHLEQLAAESLADGYVAKPFDLDELIAVVHQYTNV
jgi:CheY-like chemotaxis protein